MVKVNLTREEYELLKNVVEQKREMFLQKVKTGNPQHQDVSNMLLFSRLEVKFLSLQK